MWLPFHRSTTRTHSMKLQGECARQTGVRCPFCRIFHALSFIEADTDLKGNLPHMAAQSASWIEDCQSDYQISHSPLAAPRSCWSNILCIYPLRPAHGPTFRNILKTMKFICILKVSSFNRETFKHHVPEDLTTLGIGITRETRAHDLK